jgi:hypothetical protein
MRDFGITVVRTVEPTFRGSLEDIDAVFVMFEFCGRETYAALRRQCEIAKVKFIILPQQASAWLRIFAENGLRVPGKPVDATPLPLPPPPIVHANVEAYEAQERGTAICGRHAKVPTRWQWWTTMTACCLARSRRASPPCEQLVRGWPSPTRKRSTRQGSASATVCAADAP